MKRSFLVLYLFAAGVLSLILLLLYACVQQVYRQTANDPQIQVAWDIREHMRMGLPVDAYFRSDSADLSGSLALFAVLYNSEGKPIRSSARLDGNLPQVPAGVLDFVKTNGEERVTWQPRPGVRMAMVLLRAEPLSLGIIAVGRSLREVEVRENNLRSMVGLGWLLVMGLLAVAALVQFRLSI
ncbi:MAG TPA: hypothetical protein VMI35_09815 [Puia sp.]|nr:hypothetical protein [Puia sp.]